MLKFLKAIFVSFIFVFGNAYALENSINLTTTTQSNSSFTFGKNENINYIEYKDEDKAYKYSLIPTLIGTFSIIPTFVLFEKALEGALDDRSENGTDTNDYNIPILVFASISLSGLTVGPSVGQFYSEDYFNAISFSLLRMGSIAFFIYGAKQDIMPSAIPMLSSAALFVYLIIYSVKDAPKSAQRFNEKHKPKEPKVSFYFTPMGISGKF